MNATPFSKTVEILLVEDSAGDIVLMREAFRDSRLPVNLNIVTNGEEALAYLKGDPKYAESPRPNFILLDLNLPRMDGRTLLRRIKAHPRFKGLPVVVFTSSKLDSDIREVFDMHADHYVVKPSDLKGFQEAVRQLWEFWLKSEGPLSWPD